MMRPAMSFFGDIDGASGAATLRSGSDSMRVKIEAREGDLWLPLPADYPEKYGLKDGDWIDDAWLVEQLERRASGDLSPDPVSKPPIGSDTLK